MALESVRSILFIRYLTRGTRNTQFTPHHFPYLPHGDVDSDVGEDGHGDSPRVQPRSLVSARS